MESFFRDGVDLTAISNQVVGGDSHYFDETESPVKIRGYLDSSKETEKLKGMKWLLAMMSQGTDISDFFPDVVKNVVVKSVEVKKMVYIYLVHYADFDRRCREIALLSINSFQKDLAGANQLIRGLALRVMTSIRVPDVIQIQVLAVRRCSADKSPYVRKCAAIALPKIFSLDASQLEHLEEILCTLLGDSSTMVLGSSVASFNEICPANYKLIHPHFRKICLLLTDMDEWTQVSVLQLLTRYSRSQFTDPSPGRAAAARQQAKNRSTSASKGRLSAFTAVRRRVVKKAFYSDEEDESDEEVVMLQTPAAASAAARGEDGPEAGSVFTGADADVEGDLDSDHRLLLKSSLPLLKSRNAAVVLHVCTLHFYCGSRSEHTTVQMGKALIRILKNHREIEYVVLTSIITMAQEQPLMFLAHLQDFFVKTSDPIFNRLLKLDVLASLATKDNAEAILKEFQTYIRHSNDSFVCATIRAVGRVADAAPSFACSCMEGLLQVVKCAQKARVLTEAVVTLRLLLQQNRDSKTSAVVLHQLVKLLVSDERFKEAPTARASVVWLVGEFHDVLRKLAPDILRILAPGFAEEATETKTQIANFALKLSLRLPDDENVQSLMTYVLEMTRYDVDVDLRDRSRFMTAMMGLAPSSGDAEGEVDEDALEEVSQHSEGILLAPKLPPLTLQGPVDIEGLPRFTLGSLSSVVGHHVQGYAPLPPWQEVQPDASVRESPEVSANAPGSGRYMDKTSPYADVSSSSDSDEASKKRSMGSSAAAKKLSVSDSSSDSDEDSDDSDSSEESGSSSEEDEIECSEESSSEEESDSSVSNSKPRTATSRVSSQSSQAAAGPGSMSIRKVAGPGLKKAGHTTPTVAPSLVNDAHSLPTGTSVSLLDFSYTKAPVNSSGYSAIGGGDLLSDFTPPTMQVTSPPNTTAPPALEPTGMFFGAPPTDVSATVDMFGGAELLKEASQDAHSTSDDAAILSDIMESFQVSTPEPANLQRGSGNVTDAHLATAPGLNVSDGEVLSVPHLLLKPELAGGLSASLIFRHGARPTLPGASCVLIEFKNNSSDHSIRRVRVSIPLDIRSTPIGETPLLGPGESVRHALELVLAPSVGRTTKLNITCDRGHFTSDLAVEAWEVLVPMAMSQADFVAYRSRLGGFSRNNAEILIDRRHCSDRTVTEGDKIERVVRGRFNLATVAKGRVNSGGNEASSEEWQFAGCSRKQMREEQVFVSISVDSTGKLQMQINAEDAVISATLLDVLRKTLLATFS